MAYKPSRYTVMTKTADYTALETDHEKLILLDATSGDVTLTLPGGQSINGLPSKLLVGQYESHEVRSNKRSGLRMTVMRIDAGANSVIIEPDGLDADNWYITG